MRLLTLLLALVLTVVAAGCTVDRTIRNVERPGDLPHLEDLE